MRHVAAFQDHNGPVGLAVLIVIRQGDHFAVARPAQEQDALVVERHVAGLGNVICKHRQADIVRNIQFQFGNISGPAATAVQEKHPNPKKNVKCAAPGRDGFNRGLMTGPTVHDGLLPNRLGR